jgi:hypothetical protein
LRSPTLLASVAVLALSVALDAMYARPDLERVPIDRVIANLTRIVDATPNDAEANLNLGRVHAMAWTLGKEEIEVMQRGGAPWLGYEPAHVPLTARRRDADDDEAATRHLQRALEYHRRAATLRPGDLTMQLGYAWCLDQADKADEAIPIYRRVIADGWKVEAGMTSAGPGFHALTSEAASYLLPHLDAKADAAEIADLHRKSARLKALPRAITPIVVPLDDDASVDALVDPSASVAFDLDGSGRREGWQWISPRVGWLVYDHDGSGRIDTALHMFGSVTFWLFWQNGYQALATLDDNGDGELTGAELRQLALWVDADSDGVSDTGEVRPLAAHGIVALSCRFTQGHRAQVAAMSERGVRLRDGRVRPSFDVVLSPRRSTS